MNQVWISADVNGIRQLVGCVGQSGLFTRRFENVGGFYEPAAMLIERAEGLIARPRPAGLECFDRLFVKVVAAEDARKSLHETLAGLGFSTRPAGNGKKHIIRNGRIYFTGSSREVWAWIHEGGAEQ